MMRNNLTNKTMLKVTMSMMDTMTSVLHRDFENDWSSSPFSTVLQVACIQSVFLGHQGVAASSFIGLNDRVLVSVVTPSFKSGFVGLPFHCSSVKFFHNGVRVSLFGHAH